MAPIKAILFDMFDTLMLIEKNHAFHNPSLHAIHKYLTENGIQIKFEEFEKAYVTARDSLYAEANPELEEPHFNIRIAKALKQLGYNYDPTSPLVIGATNTFCERFMTYVKIDQHTRKVLHQLRHRYELGIVSNFAIPECVYKLLERHGLEKYFDVIIVSGAINKRKPHLDIYKRALQELDATAEETVFVGDTVDADVLGPKAAGMRTIYLERRPQENAQIAGPTQTIKSLDQLVAAVEKCSAP